MRALLRSRRRLRARLTALHEREVARTRRQALLLELTARRLAERQGIASLPMKGPFLGEAVYGDPGRRPAADIDLLVAPEHLWRAVAIAREAGYAPPEDPLDGDGMPLLYCALRHERWQLSPLELHWRVHWQSASSPPARSPAARPVPAACAGRCPPTRSPACCSSMRATASRGCAWPAT